MRNVWVEAKSIKLSISNTIKPNFNYSFDNKINKDVKSEMLSFMDWIKTTYGVPITIWIDFQYKNYLLSREKKRVGFLFYWSDFTDYPSFYNSKEIPVIVLPVKADSWKTDEILTSFIEAMTYYYCWLLNIDLIDCDLEFADSILDKYRKYKKNSDVR